MKNRRDLVLIVLALGVAVQVLVAASRGHPVDAAGVPAAQLAVGDALPRLEGVDVHGNPSSIPLANDDGVVTVLFAYHSVCAHSDTVAPDWTSFLADGSWSAGRARTLAVTRDLPDAALAYAERFAWDVEILSTPDVPPSDIRHSLVSRTPWVFVFDPDGVLRFQGHGEELDLVERAVAALASATSPGPDRRTQ